MTAPTVVATQATIRRNDDNGLVTAIPPRACPRSALNSAAPSTPFAPAGPASCPVTAAPGPALLTVPAAPPPLAVGPEPGRSLPPVSEALVATPPTEAG